MTRSSNGVFAPSDMKKSMVREPTIVCLGKEQEKRKNADNAFLLTWNVGNAEQDSLTRRGNCSLQLIIAINQQFTSCKGML